MDKWNQDEIIERLSATDWGDVFDLAAGLTTEIIEEAIEEAILDELNMMFPSDEGDDISIGLSEMGLLVGPPQYWILIRNSTNEILIFSHEIEALQDALEDALEQADNVCLYCGTPIKETLVAGRVRFVCSSCISRRVMPPHEVGR